MDKKQKTESGKGAKYEAPKVYEPSKLDVKDEDVKVFGAMCCC